MTTISNRLNGIRVRNALLLFAALVLLASAVRAQNLNLSNQKASSGTVAYEEPGTITATTYTVSGSASVRLTAGLQVKLEPGFHATAGSAPVTFDAKVGQGSQLYLTLGGQITSAGAALPGVTVTLTGGASGTASTAADGSYSFQVLAGGNYAVTPSLANSGFTPATAAFWNLDMSGVANFQATAGTSPPFTLNTTPPSKEYVHMNGQVVAVENWQ